MRHIILNCKHKAKQVGTSILAPSQKILPNQRSLNHNQTNLSMWMPSHVKCPCLRHGSRTRHLIWKRAKGCPHPHCLHQHGTPTTTNTHKNRQPGSHTCRKWNCQAELILSHRHAVLLDQGQNKTRPILSVLAPRRQQYWWLFHKAPSNNASQDDTSPPPEAYPKRYQSCTRSNCSTFEKVCYFPWNQHSGLTVPSGNPESGFPGA